MGGVVCGEAGLRFKFLLVLNFIYCKGLERCAHGLVEMYRRGKSCFGIRISLVGLFYLL